MTIATKAEANLAPVEPELPEPISQLQASRTGLPEMHAWRDHSRSLWVIEPWTWRMDVAALLAWARNLTRVEYRVHPLPDPERPTTLIVATGLLDDLYVEVRARTTRDVTADDARVTTETTLEQVATQETTEAYDADDEPAAIYDALAGEQQAVPLGAELAAALADEIAQGGGEGGDAK